MPVVNVFSPDGSSGVPSPVFPPTPSKKVRLSERPDLMNSPDAARVYEAWRKTYPWEYMGVPPGPCPPEVRRRWLANSTGC
jgi:hypothetical protein